jgi:hypothetical protein
MVYPLYYVSQDSGQSFKLFEYEEPSTHAEFAYVVFETVYSQKEVKTIHVVSSEKE